jgi:hypothetical protein
MCAWVRWGVAMCFVWTHLEASSGTWMLNQMTISCWWPRTHTHAHTAGTHAHPAQLETVSYTNVEDGQESRHDSDVWRWLPPAAVSSSW